MYRVLTALLLLSPSTAHAAGPLDLGAGTAELGGRATVDLFFGANATAASVLLAPSGGYFLADRAELLGGLSLWLGDGASAWGLSVGGRYVTPMNANHAYVGGLFNYGQFALGSVSFQGDASLSAIGGFLFPLGPKVAADVGARINIPLEQQPLYIPIGYFGVAAFFP